LLTLWTLSTKGQDFFIQIWNYHFDRSISPLQNKGTEQLKFTPMEISEQQIADKVIARLLENDLEVFKAMISKTQTSKSTNSAEPKPEGTKIKERIMELVNRKLSKTKPNSEHLIYKTDFEISGLSDILYNIASILKICIMALENADSGYDTKVLQFHTTIQNSLDLVLQLLPFEEVDCLEEIIEVYILPNETKGK